MHEVAGPAGLYRIKLKVGHWSQYLTDKYSRANPQISTGKLH